MTDGTSAAASARRLRDRKPSRKRPVTDGRTTDRPAGAVPAARPRRRLHLLPRHRAQIEALLREHLPDVEVWAYGSRISGDSHDGSDLDLVLRAPGLEKVPMDPLFDLWEALRESTIPFLVEARDWARLPESFHGEIERDYVVLVKGAPDCATETAATTEPAKRHPGPRHPGPRRHRHWKEYAVRELIDTGSLEIGDGYRATNSELSTSGLPFARAGNIRDGFHFDDADCFPAENLHRVKNKASIPGDVVFTSKGTVGRFAFVRENTPRFVYSPQLCFWRSLDTALIDPRYLFYWMSGPDFFRQFKEVSGQTDMAEFVSLRDQRDMRITLPPVREQRAIARVLGALDDRIELNRRMNATLEAMARALFKSWFVDFDPVRAKMAGRDTGLPKDIAGLFPNRLVDSAIGRVPVGWIVAPLTELMDVNPKRLLSRGQVAPYLDMANMPTRGHVPNSIVGRPTGSGMRFTNGDTLVARITPCLENGKTAYVDFLGTREVGWGSTEYIVLKPKPPLPDEFAYCVARNARFRQFAVQNMSGTSGRQRVPAAALADFEICAPPVPVAARFGCVARSLFRRASRAVIESRALAVTRDTLLPKLISGEMRVRDVEKIAGVA